MVTACGQRFKIISFVSFTGPKSEAYCWRGMLVNLQPVVSCYVRSRTQHSYAFLIFIMFASKLSINGKTACLKTWFSCGRTRSFHHFLESFRSFLFSYPEPFIWEEVCDKFSRSMVRASWLPKQPTALDQFTCGTTHPFMFPDKLPIFLSLVSWIFPLLLQSL